MHRSTTLRTAAVAVLFLQGCTGSLLDEEVPTLDFPTAATTTTPAPEVTTPPTAPPTTILTVHIVAPGETLGRIAAAYETNIGSLVDANNITDPDSVRAGDEIVVAVSRVSREGEATYTVGPGETLGYIAGLHGVTQQALIDANGLPNPNAIAVGQDLVIPVVAQAAETTELTNQAAVPEPAATATVTRVPVARAPELAPSALPSLILDEWVAVSRRARGLDDGRTPRSPIQAPAQTPAPSVATPAQQSAANAAPNSGVHVVVSGETLWAIADSYGANVSDMVAINNLADPDKLRLGQELQIPG